MRQAAAAILRNNGKVLLQLRDEDPRIDHPGFWSFLGGGIKAGETPVEALRRELLDEIGVDVPVLEFLQTVEVLGNPLCRDLCLHVFLGSLTTPAEAIHLTEGQRVACFSLEALEPLRVPAVLKALVRRYRERIFVDQREGI